ncbi:N-acetylneuraminate synthase family protein [Treponema sp.]|uniref:N-acetylneuraminate synthase family protein n=1 Tax=Treponema sp. TaxID=166 RepID=UPI00298DC411|nr:N-acetylneuraminate synthase family protein [Treponema sp.]MCQ2240599.1 N-acetylneuraminate synthase family protein [Treponema sp.]
MTIIAEIGTAHSGDIKKALELIDASVEAGADCVKFQWVYADEILHPDTGFVDLPNGRTRLYDNFKTLECNQDFYSQCMEYARKKGILFACSPFGLRSLKELAQLNPDAIKIASPEVNHYPMLRECAKYYGKIPLILSSGVSKLGDIEKAIELIETRKETENLSMKMPSLTLLHCLTFYPAPEEEYNVRCVNTLGQIFGVPTGISDHSMDPVLVPVLSVAMGGTMIEKHITLSRKDSGLDDPVALEPEMFKVMVHSVHQAEAVLRHSGENEIYRQLEYEYSRERIDAILGNGIKKLAPAETANYGSTNRSLHYMRSMKKGERIGADGIAVLRTEKILTPGIGPEFLELVTGAVLTRDVENGAGVRLEDFIEK